LIHKGVVTTCKAHSPQRCRHFRIRQIGKNHNGFDTLVLSGFNVLEQYHRRKPHRSNLSPNIYRSPIAETNNLWLLYKITFEAMGTS
jgi:hypothetical protein